MALSTNNRRPFNIACHRTVQPAEFHCRRQQPFYVQGAVSCKLLQGEYKGYLSTPGRRKSGTGPLNERQRNQSDWRDLVEEVRGGAKVIELFFPVGLLTRVGHDGHFMKSFKAARA